MLQFTHDSKKSTNQNYDEMNYEPIIITNGTGKQKLMPEQKRSQKKIMKVHSNSKGKSQHAIRRTEKTFVNK